MKSKKLNASIRKRILSFVLALSMLAAIAPQPLEPLFAQAASEGKNYIFDFRKEYPTDSKAITYKMNTVGDDDELNKGIYSQCQ